MSATQRALLIEVLRALRGIETLIKKALDENKED